MRPRLRPGATIPTMELRVLAFASATEAMGAAERTLDLPAAARIADLRDLLARDFPRLRPLLPRLAIAVDGVVAGDDRALHEGAEVALLPPVSGG